MRKMTMIAVTVAVMVTANIGNADTVYIGDDPSEFGVAQTYPLNNDYPGEFGPKQLFIRGERISNVGLYDATRLWNDGISWNQWEDPPLNDAEWGYMMVKIKKPAGYTTGTCTMRVSRRLIGNRSKGENDYIHLLRWSATTGWIGVDTIIDDNGCQSFSVPPSWFNPTGNLIFCVYTALVDTHQMICSVWRIDY